MGDTIEWTDPHATLDELVQSLAKSGVVTPEEVRTVIQAVMPEDTPVDSRTVVQNVVESLVEQDKLTPFQSVAVTQGKANQLVLGDYVIQDKLGEGGMGMVFKAQHRRMKRTVALKVLSPAIAKSLDKIQRFQREVEAAARLTHPQIVTAYDAGEQNGVHYLVMEFVEGCDLTKVVQKLGPMPPARAVDFIKQAARGLEYAHGKGIVHRDIKPSNLLLDGEGTVKILDMGLARFTDALAMEGAEAQDGGGLTQSGSIMGTVDFMSPEQAMDSKRADHRADIYSLGCSLYYLLTGRKLYRGETLMQTLLAHREEPIPTLADHLPDAPSALDAVYRKMVAKRPEDRQQSMAQVIAELDAIPLGAAGSGKEFVSIYQQHAATEDRTVDWQADIDLPLGVAAPGATVHTHTGQTVARTPAPVPVAAGGVPAIAWVLGGVVVAASIAAAVLFVPARPGPSLLPPEEEEVVPAVSPAAPPPPVEAKAPAAPAPAVTPFSALEAKRFQNEWAQFLGQPVAQTNSLGMKMLLIPPGEFMMGSTPDRIAELTRGNLFQKWFERFQSEAPQHLVKLTEPFYLSANEVSVAKFAAFVSATGYVTQLEKEHKALGLKEGQWVVGAEYSWRELGELTNSEDFPVVNVTWTDAGEFIKWLSQKEDGATYRLPTETEWEYACRGGSLATWSSGSDQWALDHQAWFVTNSRSRPQVVGGKEANAFGLFDMHGNVWEWCADWFAADYYAAAAAADPNGPASGQQRVLRGGSYLDNSSFGRSASRNHADPSEGHPSFGFRIARSTK